MSGGQPYWNEDAQRWESRGGAPVPPAVPPSPVPPPPPDFAPVAGPDGGWSNPELPRPGRGGFSRRTLGTVLGGAAVAGAALALVLTLVVGNGDGEGNSGSGEATDDGKATAAPPSSGPPPSTAPPSDTPTPKASSPSPSAEVPAGYELYDDAEGFTVARPLGWTREAIDSQYGMDVVNYRSADGERRLQVFEVAETSPEESFELFLSDETPKADGFEELSLERLDDGDYTGSRLEYLADAIKGEPDIGPWHVVDERFEAADGKLYALAAYGPDADGRDDERELLRTALDHFCPPYHPCGESAWLD
ncbi:hypothetical protein [Streptomyces sp. NPDC057877]|uniref:hypothetical protein n=1 Tax=Streptomyces sp. NPDC057877 TaxID=3346269 RepID=UPI00367DF27F